MFPLVEAFVVILALITIATFKKATKTQPPTLNVYRRRTPLYHLKLLFMHAVLSLRKIAARRKRSPEETARDIEKEEKPRELIDDKRAVDAVYFTGGNRDGDYLVAATARRQNKLVDGFFYLKIKSSGLGVLESPKLPDTSLYQNDDENGYSAEGIAITVVQPMKKWNISYKGKMKRYEDRSKTCDVEIDAQWSSDLPYFNADTDMDNLSIAEPTAKEIWSKTYFENLKKIHQIHYEHPGKILGTATIDGVKYPLDIDTLRDHSFGSREWRLFHRYALHYFTSENGDRFAVCIISMPIAYSSLTLGHVYSKKDNVLRPIKFCDFQMYQHGENGVPPVDYAFTFKTETDTYTAQVEVIDSPSFYISKDWESKIFERFCRYKVNGNNAWGIAEWQYRNIAGRNTNDKIN